MNTPMQEGAALSLIIICTTVFMVGAVIRMFNTNPENARQYITKEAGLICILIAIFVMASGIWFKLFFGG
jgi:hypothetical protein